ncbi:excinuclease ABC subunit UvrA [Candidatus Fermentibacteria bacterium]|nr:excinuclease ABC subunit UvrA [Candidatus Fermentibacteria bacterium]
MRTSQTAAAVFIASIDIRRRSRENEVDPREWLIVRKAAVHNLKNIDVAMPRDRLVVITGPSGSGKSSLAFDTIYAEGQRRYVESLSAYARQFLGLMDKPDVESIEGLSPAISIEQRKPGHNPRSTVGTTTEIFDYLRLLYARLGAQHCPQCGRPVERRTVEQMAQQVLSSMSGARISVLAPVVRGRKGEYRDLFERLAGQGFVRARVNGGIHRLEEIPGLAKHKKHTIEVVVDRIAVDGAVKSRLVESMETAAGLSGGLVIVVPETGEEVLYSRNNACAVCELSFEELQPRLFSFNSPYGACDECSGLGVTTEIDSRLVIPDQGLSLARGAIAPWCTKDGGLDRFRSQMLQTLASAMGFSLETPFAELPPDAQHAILHGTTTPLRFSLASESGRQRWEWTAPFEGVIPFLSRRYQQSSPRRRALLEKYMSMLTCAACGGTRLRAQSRAVLLREVPIHRLTGWSISQIRAFFEGFSPDAREHAIGGRILTEIQRRLRFLDELGIGYLTLDRATGTLAGGEAQRIRLASQLGSGLVGVLYVLDEPSIGLHARDQDRLLAALCSLRDAGNTVLVVEHDRQTMLLSDWVVDLGPGAGTHGGHVIYAGPPGGLAAQAGSLTGDYLAGRRQIFTPDTRRQGSGQAIEVVGAAEHNLKDITACFPLGCFICVTGVSGSGKSTLVHEILHKSLARRLHGARSVPGAHHTIRGAEHIDGVVLVDQDPIGRTPRSNPATYAGAFGPIRDLFAKLPEARARGYGPGRFSFNVAGGRCEACQGAGVVKIEMHFLPDVYVTCEQCGGRRFGEETLAVKYKGLSISDILNTTVEEAVTLFGSFPAIIRKIAALRDVGLGYLSLGQPATTLSGGEAQRVKLATELCKGGSGRTLYILDEPTTGLHFEDIRVLLQVLFRLVSRGDTVVVIEHSLDVIKCADWIIDLGPEAGAEGGRIVVAGTPEEVAEHPRSCTGRFLKAELGRV